MRMVPDVTAAFNVRSLHQTRFINRQIRDIKPTLLQKSAHFKDSGVLDLAGNNVGAFGLKSKSGTDYRVIVGFSASAGEYDFFRSAIEQRSHLLAGSSHRPFRRNAVPMGAGWVTELLEEWFHRGDDFRVKRRSAVVIKVNRVLHWFCFTAWVIIGIGDTFIPIRAKF